MTMMMMMAMATVTIMMMMMAMGMGIIRLRGTVFVMIATVHCENGNYASPRRVTATPCAVGWTYHPQLHRLVLLRSLNSTDLARALRRLTCFAS